MIDLRKLNFQRGMDSSLKRNRTSYGLVSEFDIFVLVSCYEEQGEQFVFCVEKEVPTPQV